MTPAHQIANEDALGRLFLWLGFGGDGQDLHQKSTSEGQASESHTTLFFTSSTTLCPEPGLRAARRTPHAAHEAFGLHRTGNASYRMLLYCI
ncbi:hypothetical protein BW686_22565 [Pseudomonas syringae]|uniref:Uncharacterized protein n=1 Tax=Pseudomonas syringae TaxID=317 RepID=A0A244EM65_PSESX|nr:hypothetical protein BW686_22565 [Pseudomonas syringae]